MRRIRLSLTAAVCTVLHAQPPAIRQNGVVNSASRIPSGLTGGSLALRSRFTIDGVRLSDPAAETRVRLRHGERSILLPVISADPKRIDALLPADAPLGNATLTVESAAGESLPFPVTVVSIDPGLYTINQKGWGPGKIKSAPARSGDLVELTATGFGDARTAHVNVGGRLIPANVMHGLHGLDALRFRIPPGVPAGCFVPVYAIAESGPRSNVVTIAVGDSRNCAMPEGWPTPAETGSSAILGISRSSTMFALNQPVVTNDEAFAAFFSRGWPADPNAVILLPPPGLCAAYTAMYAAGTDFDSIAAVLAHLGDDPALDAGGPLSIAGAAGTRAIPRSGTLAGEYWTRLGFEDASRRRTVPLFLNDPQYRFTIPGGKQIGAFSETVPDFPQFVWTNRDPLSTVDRTRPLRIAWTGAPQDATMLIVAASFDAASTAGGVCYCAAASQGGAFEIPPQMFARFPATAADPGPSRGGVMLIAVRARRIAGKLPSGLDVLRTLSIRVDRRRAEFK